MYPLNPDRYFDPNPTIRNIARDIYNEIKDLPIISPHGHVDPKLFAENKPFPNPTELFLIPDHYLFRMLFSQGIKLEDLGIPTIDGSKVETDPRKIWKIFGENYFLFNGTPSGAWLDYEFNLVFDIKEKLNGWKTPQIKSCFEPIAMAQKPVERTYLNNILEHEIGLLNTNIKIGKNKNMYPANVFTVESINALVDKIFLLPKPTKKEKGEYNDHKTVKPLAICEYLINLSAFSQNAVVLDPFVGSGTTAVAAKKMNKYYIGIDSNERYVKIAEQRLKEIDFPSNSDSFANP